MRTAFTAIELLVFIAEMALGVTASVFLGDRIGGIGFILGFIVGFAIIPGLFFSLRGLHHARARRRVRAGVS